MRVRLRSMSSTNLCKPASMAHSLAYNTFHLLGAELGVRFVLKPKPWLEPDDATSLQDHLLLDPPQQWLAQSRLNTITRLSLILLVFVISHDFARRLQPCLSIVRSFGRIHFQLSSTWGRQLESGCPRRPCLACLPTCPGAYRKIPDSPIPKIASQVS